jgi:hypothetical protein
MYTPVAKYCTNACSLKQYDVLENRTIFTTAPYWQNLELLQLPCFLLRRAEINDVIFLDAPKGFYFSKTFMRLRHL